MAYVAIRGGEQAIASAARALEKLRAKGGSPLEIAQVKDQLWALHGKVLSEGGVHDEDLTALALKQCAGDTLEAAFTLRAWRSTRPRLMELPAVDTSAMRVERRISAAFKDIPGGQLLGATADFAQRLFRFELLDESPQAFAREAVRMLPPGADVPESFPKVLEYLRVEGLLPAPAQRHGQPFDITREPLVFPVPRSAALAVMARAESGGLLALAYSSMRGYGDVHPTVAELRVGRVPVTLPHAVTGEPVEFGEVMLTECEVVAMFDKSEGDDAPTFGLGYGACFGRNEIKAISMAILDRGLQRGMARGPRVPAEDPEFVLLHVDGVDSMGFCQHYKMPHYVTFLSDIDRLRRARENAEART